MENHPKGSVAGAPFLARWLRVLFFWGLFSSIVFVALRMDPVQILIQLRFEAFIGNPDLIPVCLKLAALAGSVFLFVKLGHMSSYYRCVIFCLILSAAVNLALVGKGRNSPTWWAMSLLGLIVSVVKTYQLYHGHAEVLSDLNPVLADKWRRLWKWCVRLLAGVLVGVLTARMFPTLGGILLLVIFAGVAVQRILEFIYLWQTGTAFRNCVSTSLDMLSEPNDI